MLMTAVETQGVRGKVEKTLLSSRHLLCCGIARLGGVLIKHKPRPAPLSTHIRTPCADESSKSSSLAALPEFIACRCEL